MKKDKNTISQEQIDSWKAEYGHVFKTDVEGEVIVYHPLRRSDYIEIMSNEKDEEGNDQSNDMLLYGRQEEVCRRTVLIPENIDAILVQIAGCATVLSEQILGHSGFRISEADEL